MKIKKTGKSKFGYWILNEEDKFFSVTEQVSGFLSKQVPCEIEVEEQEGEGNKTIIKRVKVTGQSAPMQDANEFEQPVETSKPGEQVAKPNYYDQQSKTQNTIKAQFCTREGLQIIAEHNKISEGKIEPTMSNLLNNAKIVWNVIDSLLQEEIISK